MLAHAPVRLFRLCAPALSAAPLRLLLLLALLAAMCAAPQAHAAFAGKNGVVVHEGTESNRGSLYLRESTGNLVARLQVGGRPRDPAFSPQGRRIAFARAGNLWTVYDRGSGLRSATTGPEGDGDPAFSGQGDALVFTRGPRGARDLYRVAIDGTRLQRLTYRAADDYEPAWSASGAIAFVRDTAAGDGDLWVMGPDSSSSAVRVTEGDFDDRSPSWSPDGRLLAFTRRENGRRELRIVGVEDGEVAPLRVRNERNGKPLDGVSDPVWSPDGRRVVFSAGLRGRTRLYVVKATGGKARTISLARAGAQAPDWQTVSQEPVVAAVGDIACPPIDPGYGGGEGIVDRCRQRHTSELAANMDLAGVLMLGDLQYPDGNLAAFQQSFEPTWGRMKDLMFPVPGNHEYRVPGAAGYFDYFNGPGRPTGQAGSRDAGYYSFDLGSWHVLALNSQCAHPPRRPTATGCAAGSPQEQWLRADLAANPAACTLAVWHHPLFSSGIEQPSEPMRPLWRALHEAGADVILNSHDHAYERFAPQNPEGVADPATGIRQFISGAGGYSHQQLFVPEANSEARNAQDFGVLRLVMREGGYDWQFVTEHGAVADSGNAACH